MNKAWITSNIDEAVEQLQETIKNLAEDSEYDYGDFAVDMSHAFHHLNTAWNSQGKSEAEVTDSTETDFYDWRRFPSNEELLLTHPDDDSAG
jgi:hypothetical protein